MTEQVKNHGGWVVGMHRVSGGNLKGEAINILLRLDDGTSSLELVLNKEAAKGLHRTLGAAIDSMPEEKS